MFLLWASPPHAGAETLPPDVQAFLADDAPTVEDAAAWQWDDLLGWLAGAALTKMRSKASTMSQMMPSSTWTFLLISAKSGSS